MKESLDQILGQSFKSDPIKKGWTAVLHSEPIWEALHLGLGGLGISVHKDLAV